MLKKNFTVWAGLNSIVFIALFLFTRNSETSYIHSGLLALISMLLCAPLMWLFIKRNPNPENTETQPQIPLAVYPMTGYICLGFLTLITGKDNASHTDLFFTAIALLVISVLAMLLDRCKSHRHKTWQYNAGKTVKGC